MGDDDVAAMRQGSIWQRLVSVPAHDDGMTCGELAKASHVLLDMIEQSVLVADCSISVHTNDDIKHFSIR